MNPLKTLTRILIPILIITVALVIGRIIIKTTKKPEKKRPPRGAYVVKTIPLKKGTQTVRLRATGTVVPALQITLRARVSGEIVEVAPNFISGGSFKKGARILKIDPADFLLVLDQKKAALADAEFQLRLEEGQRDIAAREWELLESDAGSSDADRELALRVPHMKYRAAKLEAAKAELEKAKLDLARTEVRAPFNAVVVERKTDLGTQVNLQDALAILSGSDEFYVRASIPVDRLKWIVCDPEKGSPVTITRSTGEVRAGRAVQLESALEEKGRMAQVLVSVKNPLKGEQPLLLNEYVHLEFEGASLENTFLIPRSALHNDRFIWLATPKRTLQIREVDVRWRDATDVLIFGEINAGAQLILTNLSTPINGMSLRVSGDPEPKPGRGDDKGKGKGGGTPESKSLSPEKDR